MIDSARAELRSVCVYCGSAAGTNPEHTSLAHAVGGGLAARGLRLVYGGGGVGLMGVCARAAIAAGGAVKGIMPEFLAVREHLLDAGEQVVVSSMHERKLAMFHESDGFLVLPGGIGTLDEAIETLSWRRLDLHAKPMVFLHRAFWAPFVGLMTHLEIHGFVPKGRKPFFHLADSLEEALAIMAQEIQ